MINDAARFFKGDFPARKFVAGHQKAGNFICTSCSIHSNHVKNICFSNKKRNNVTARSNRESEKHNNVTDQITKTANKAL